MEKFDSNKQVDRIIDVANAIQPNKITILTGGNGKGKSVVRKVSSFALAKKLNKDPQHLVASTSMQARTELRSDFGALSSCMHDTPSSATSENSLSNIKRVLKFTERYIVIDEPEIGMGEEFQLAIAKYISSKYDVQENFGLLVITHSRIIVKNLPHDEFLNLDGMTEQEWLNREIVAVDLDKFEEESSELYMAIQKRSVKD